MPTPRRDEPPSETQPLPTWPLRRHEDDDGPPTRPYEPSREEERTTPSDELPTPRREENAAPTADGYRALAEHGDDDSEGHWRGEEDVADYERRGDEHTEPVGDRRVDVPRTIADLEHLVLAPDHVDSETLAEAKQRLADNQPLTRADMNAVLHLAVEAARSGIEAEYGEGQFAQREVSGLCGPVQQGITDLLAHILGPEANIQMHASHPNEVGGASIEGSKLQGDVRHYFTTITAPDGRVYLVDPTFVQFTTDAGTVAQRLLDHGGGAAAQQLMQQGFVELTPDVANAYGRALTKKDEEFTPQHFITGNRAPDEREGQVHGGCWSGRMIDATEAAKRRWDEA